MIEFEPTIIDGIAIINYIKLENFIHNTQPITYAQESIFNSKLCRYFRGIRNDGHIILIYNCPFPYDRNIPMTTLLLETNYVFGKKLKNIFASNNTVDKLPEKVQKLLKFLVVL